MASVGRVSGLVFKQNKCTKLRYSYNSGNLKGPTAAPAKGVAKEAASERQRDAHHRSRFPAPDDDDDDAEYEDLDRDRKSKNRQRDEKAPEDEEDGHFKESNKAGVSLEEKLKRDNAKLENVHDRDNAARLKDK